MSQIYGWLERCHSPVTHVNEIQEDTCPPPKKTTNQPNKQRKTKNMPDQSISFTRAGIFIGFIHSYIPDGKNSA